MEKQMQECEDQEIIQFRKERIQQTRSRFVCLADLDWIAETSTWKRMILSQDTPEERRNSSRCTNTRLQNSQFFKNPPTFQNSEILDFKILNFQNSEILDFKIRNMQNSEILGSKFPTSKF